MILVAVNTADDDPYNQIPNTADDDPYNQIPGAEECDDTVEAVVRPVHTYCLLTDHLLLL